MTGPPAHGLAEALRGTLQDGAICSLLADLRRTRPTGRLRFTGVEEVERGRPHVARRTLHLDGGAVVGVDSNVDAETLVNVLRRRGTLSAADLTRAEAKAREERRSVEDVLEDSGLLGPDRRREALLGRLQEGLCRIFSWSDGAYTFEPRSAAGPPEAMVTLDTLVEAVLARLGPDEIEQGLGDESRVLHRLETVAHVDLSPVSRALLAEIDGRRSAAQVIGAVQGPPEEARLSLLHLLCLGAATFAAPVRASAPVLPARPEPAPPPAPVPPPQAPAPSVPVRPAPRVAPASAPVRPAPRVAPASAPVRPPAKAASAVAAAQERTVRERRQEIEAAYRALAGGTHFEVLGLSRAATEAEVKQAYGERARRFHPDAHSDPELAPLREQLVAVFVASGEAYQTLRDPKKRAMYEATLPAPPPDAGESRALGREALAEALARARAALAARDPGSAIPVLESVITAPDAEADVRRVAQVLLARAYAHDPKMVRDAERLLQEVLKEDDRYVPAHMALAGVYKAGGMKSRAERAYRKVLEIDASHREALSALVGLETD